MKDSTIHMYVAKRHQRLGSNRIPAVKIRCTGEWLEYGDRPPSPGYFMGHNYAQPNPHRTVPWGVTCIKCLRMELADLDKKRDRIIKEIDEAARTI